ncbi:EH domain-containing protein 1 [Borealophlyctis nickersoniae]|nr:EH domain-containing protein 1 [Borealophlyctis nickersoniae]
MLLVAVILLLQAFVQPCSAGIVSGLLELLYPCMPSFVWYGLGLESLYLNNVCSLEGDVQKAVACLYRHKVQPFEKATFYYDFYDASEYAEADFLARPSVLFTGEYSVGKTSMIEFLLGRPYKKAHIGPAATTDSVMVVMKGDGDFVSEGAAAAMRDDLPYTTFANRFGGPFVAEHFKIVEMDHPMLKDVTLVDTPGILSSKQQDEENKFDLAGVAKWFADRAALIVVLFDKDKLAPNDNFKRALKGIRVHKNRVIYCVNKADALSPVELCEVRAAVQASIQSLVRTSELVNIRMGNFRDAPYIHKEFKEQFDNTTAYVRERIDELANPRMSKERRVDLLSVRARNVWAHAILVSHLGELMQRKLAGWCFWNCVTPEQAQEEIVGKLESIMNYMIRQPENHGVQKGDFPDVPTLQETLRAWIENHKGDHKTLADFPFVRKVHRDALKQASHDDARKLIKAINGTTEKTRVKHDEI